MSWILFLSITGIILLCFEVFLPGAVMGVMGALCLVVAVILTYTLYGPGMGNMALVMLVAGSAVALLLWIRFFPRSRTGKILITRRDLADFKSAEPLEGLMGQEGKAITPLRPAGTALLGGQRIDVVAESGLIDSESPVKVVCVEGNRVVVRKN